MLRTRLISALVLIPSVLFLAWLGRPFFDALVAICGGTMAWEWARLRDRDGLRPSAAVVIVAVVGSVIAFALAGLWVALAILALGCAAAVATAVRGGERRFVWIALGPIYVGLPCVAMLWLRSHPQAGFPVVVWLLVLVWAVDTAAFAAGRSIGGPRLLPAVSPKKTWAGLAGGVTAGAIVGMAFAAIEPGRPVLLLGVIGAALAVLEQAGDLLESAIKRRFEVKDSGTLIPGHGGLLDRVDGLMPVAVAVAALLMFGADRPLDP